MNVNVYALALTMEMQLFPKMGVYLLHSVWHRHFQWKLGVSEMGRPHNYCYNQYSIIKMIPQQITVLQSRNQQSYLFPLYKGIC